MDAEAAKLLDLLLREPSELLRLTLADALEESGDPRAAAVRAWTHPGASARLTPHRVSPEFGPPRDFPGESHDAVLVPHPWAIQRGFAHHFIRDDQRRAPATLHLGWPDGRLALSMSLAPGGGCEYWTEEDVLFPGGLLLRLESDGWADVRFLSGYARPDGLRLGLSARLLGADPLAWWLRAVAFPEVSPPGGRAP